MFFMKSSAMFWKPFFKVGRKNKIYKISLIMKEYNWQKAYLLTVSDMLQIITSKIIRIIGDLYIRVLWDGALNCKKYWTLTSVIVKKVFPRWRQMWRFSEKLGHLPRPSASRYFWWLAFVDQPVIQPRYIWNLYQMSWIYDLIF